MKFSFRSSHVIMIFQAGFDDVSEAADAELEHDAQMAASGDFQLRVLDVPQHHRRLVSRARESESECPVARSE